MRTLSSTPADVRDYFTYDAETGLITRIRTDRGDMRGKRVLGTKVGSGRYICVFHKGAILQAQRLAWFLHYGRDAKGLVDHINGNPQDNRIANLREATSQQNNFNQRRKSGSHSTLKGAQFHTATGKFRSAIRISDGTRIFLGNFNTDTEAHEAYCRAARKYHGEFARTE